MRIAPIWAQIVDAPSNVTDVLSHNIPIQGDRHRIVLEAGCLFLSKFAELEGRAMRSPLISSRSSGNRRPSSTSV